jgi:hypothetical protein
MPVEHAKREEGGEEMDPGERTTGTHDEHYNLVSVLYHALQGAENCDIYATDAEASGRVELSDFFREAQEIQRELADRAKGLLGIESAAMGTAAGDVPAGGTTVGSDVPLTGSTVGGEVPPRGATSGAGGATIGSAIPPATASGDIPPRSADVQREPDVRADEAGVPTEDVSPWTDGLRSEEVVTPSDTAPSDVDVASPGRAEVTPDVRTEEVPPRTQEVPTSEEVLRTEDVSREPSEPRPVEEPVEAERRADTGETIQDLIRETNRRSRGEI